MGSGILLVRWQRLGLQCGSCFRDADLTRASLKNNVLENKLRDK
jgi:hypothetical protein